MSKEMSQAYQILRSKDEVMAESTSAVPAAVVLAMIGIIAFTVGAWKLGIVVMVCAAVFAVWHRIYGAIADACIKRLGYSEIELERLDLA